MGIIAGMVVAVMIVIMFGMVMLIVIMFIMIPMLMVLVVMIIMIVFCVMILIMICMVVIVIMVVGCRRVRVHRPGEDRGNPRSCTRRPIGTAAARSDHAAAPPPSRSSPSHCATRLNPAVGAAVGEVGCIEGRPVGRGVGVKVVLFSHTHSLPTRWQQRSPSQKSPFLPLAAALPRWRFALLDMLSVLNPRSVGSLQRSLKAALQCC